MVPWESLLGKASEHQIQHRLDYFSHTQKLENDIGIDFYCTLIENNLPVYEFYVQAKGTEHFSDRWSARVKKSTVNYWLEKPNPVFLVVYDEPNKKCYWMSIERSRYELIEKMRQSDSKTVSITLDTAHFLEQGKNKNSEFIQQVKNNRISIAMYHGQPSFKGEDYVKQLPDQPRNQEELFKIKENIRQSLYSLVIHYFNKSDLETARSYCEFLTNLDPRGHFNHFEWLGLIYLELGQKDLAKKNFEQALRICKSDRIWPKESMKRIINDIESFIQMTEGKFLSRD